MRRRTLTYVRMVERAPRSQETVALFLHMADKQSKRPLIDQRLVRSLAHPVRVEILDALTEQTLSPNQLKDIIDQPLGHVSYHVRVLTKYEAIELVRTKQRRGATEHFFQVKPDAFVGSPGWRQVPKVLLRSVSGASLRSLFDKATKALEQGHLDRKDATVTWLPLAIDEQGRQEVADVCAAAIDRLQAVQKNSRRRLAQGGAITHYIVGVLSFEAAGEP